MFALGIRYLNGWAMATDVSNRDAAEWPPHPDRIFMALVAAHFESDGDAAELALLRWIEGLGSPEIVADEACFREVTTSYVPVNDTRSGMELIPEQRTRQARSFPVAIPTPHPDDGMPRVYLIWRDAACPDEPAFSRLCEKVTSVGHSASLVQMWVEETPPPAVLIPVDNVASNHRLRVQFEGRLNDLVRAFDQESIDDYNGLLLDRDGEDKQAAKSARQRLRAEYNNAPPRPLRPVARRWQAYAPICNAPESESPAGTVFDPNLIILHRVEGPRLGLESTLQVTEALRGAVFTTCDIQPPPAWVSGHTSAGAPTNEPHVALLPLADVGHHHARGHLLGVALAIPRGITASEQACLGTVLFHTEEDIDAIPGTPRTIELTMGRLGVWRIELAEQDHRAGLAAESWTGMRPNGDFRGSDTWASVTPIVFDRHPKEQWNRSDPPRIRAEREAAYWAGVEAMIADACESIGLPRPIDVVASPTSSHAGAPRAADMPRDARKDGTKRRQTHAVLRFAAPVIGPVLIGAGRYRGYGLCRPLRETAS